MLVTPATRQTFLSVFNDFSQLAGEVRASDFLRDYVEPSLDPASAWMTYRDMLTAMEYARRELRSEYYADSASRPYEQNQGTTWLSYATFRFRPSVPAELSAFLEDTVNRTTLLSDYVAASDRWSLCVKIDFPLGGSFAYLLNADQHRWIAAERERVLRVLQGTPVERAFAEVAGWRSALSAVPVPQLVVECFNLLISDERWRQRALLLGTLEGGSVPD